jgi:hypothetical protein
MEESTGEEDPVMGGDGEGGREIGAAASGGEGFFELIHIFQHDLGTIACHGSILIIRNEIIVDRTLP